MGQAPIWLAVLLMLALAAIMGLYQAALGYACARWLPQAARCAGWSRCPQRGCSSSGGAAGSSPDSRGCRSATRRRTPGSQASRRSPASTAISALLLLAAGALVTLALGSPRERLVALIALALPWGVGAALYRHSWTQASGAPVSVAVIQGAIPQDEKWLASNHDTTLNLYQSLTEKVLGTQLIVWPESAPADVANDLVDYLKNLYRETSAHGSALVMGVLRAEGAEPDTRYYNSVLALGDEVSWYDKHHLVPFAEFFPVPHFVRSWLRLMSLPYSDFTRGKAKQPPLPAAHLKLGATICYEDAYGSSMLSVLPTADALVNVTNDAWFGHSSARHQHLQISRMRALEAGRYMVRAANDGISGVIGPHGEVIARAPEFVPFPLVSKIVPMKGLTPYAHVGNWPVVCLAALVLAYGLWVRNDRRRRLKT